jgi:quercetin dioxygenase-like cupin family protein
MTALPDNVYSMRRAARLDDVAGWMFDRMAEALVSPPMCPELRGSMRARVLAGCGKPSATQTVRATEREWCPLVPGVAIKVLRTDAAARNMTAYFRLEPGAWLDPHEHAQPEECLVLEGEIFIGAHRLAAGDMHLAAAGTMHAAVTSPRGALLLVRAQMCTDH